MKVEHFTDFEKAYEALDRHSIKDERLTCFTREQIAEKGNSLDLGLIRDESVVDFEDLPDLVDSREEAIALLDEASDLIKSVVNELKSTEQ